MSHPFGPRALDHHDDELGELDRFLELADNEVSARLDAIADEMSPAERVLHAPDHVRGERTCRGCGCTDTYACPGGCAWVDRDLCSRCAA